MMDHMMEWWIIVLLVLAVIVVGTHLAGVTFVVMRTLLGGTRPQKQWSQR